MISFLKRLASRLPNDWQYYLKRIRYTRQIRKNKFVSLEHEYNLVDQFIKPGDWVIDIGANVGYYTRKFSDLVGVNGRVIAIEPIPETFSLLASNVRNFQYDNVTLFNCAISTQFSPVNMDLPYFDTGIKNFFEAKITQDGSDGIHVIALNIDALGINVPISFVKIDTEGHEVSVLEGMKNLIDKYHPTLMIEINTDDIILKVEEMGYSSHRIAQSHNVVFTSLNK